MTSTILVKVKRLLRYPFTVPIQSLVFHLIFTEIKFRLIMFGQDGCSEYVPLSLIDEGT